MKKLISLTLALLLLAACCPFALADAGIFSPNEQYEYLVGAAAWQLSAESQGLMLQAFAAAKYRVAELALKCLDESEPDYSYRETADGEQAMYYQGRRVAVVCDIDDTLVDGVHYTADIVGADGDINNVAFARFVMSDGLTALPGAVDFIHTCRAYGAEVFYVTNRFDQGYKIGQSDRLGSYAQAVGEGGQGQYLDAEGNEIGATIYQTLGKSFYDITLESMTRLGFPIDEAHLIMNDHKLRGESKEAARTAIRSGAEAYPNGRRADGSITGSALTMSLEPHDIALLLGDQLGDFTDDFSGKDMDAVTRAEMTARYADQFGQSWILLPNAVYGSAMNAAVKYGMKELFAYYSYTK